MYKQLAIVMSLVCLGAFIGLARAQEDADSSRRAGLGIAVERTGQGEAGVIVGQVAPDSPAAKGGMKSGDVIQKVDKKAVRNFDDLTTIIGHHKPGDQVAVQVQRSGQEKDLKITLGVAPAEAPQVPIPTERGGQAPIPQERGGRERTGAFLGVQTRPLTPDIREQAGVTTNEGVVVTDVLPNSPAAKAGLQSGDVITSVNGKAVADPQQLREAIHKAGVGKDVDLKIARGKETKEMKTKLAEGPEGMETPPFPGFRRGPMPPNFGPPMAGESQRRIQDLQRQVEDLQRRVQELEKKQGTAAGTPK
jgi:S1-C subfamily serine protease